MEIRKYIDKIVENNKKEDMEKLSTMLSEIIYKTKEAHPDMYSHYKMCLYETAYGKKLNKDMAEEWVMNMRPAGQHWTMAEAEEVIKAKNLKATAIDYYVVINMMYNDYYKLVKDNEELALELAEQWLDDEDAKENKLFEYWKHVAKKD